ncbi:HAUS augmin-like complex subunit 6 N-terminus-domain-containing protein [Polychytrium aggregatum]|uniref:HAUS augmin-like complex subunit 6 N-terminus-domain-containing protein n=1 Tax=Polychytrium aggregatum TaxID=110093 RepID=UPI0022FEDABC|nr:HAUS augmin-like complex subunit 6 N-terminus-domain-containing protein [Polychytrium aggregatum]KAI9207799.1 HAUS augmin-like complex subunit 6 N-terminus-domain-containing protein [Polychytrium aggregatum]
MDAALSTKAILRTNLQLLGLKDPDGAIYTKHEWTTKAAETVIWFLLSNLDEPKAKERFSTCYPVLDRLQSREFRNQAFKWIEALKRDGELWSDIQIRKSYFDEYRGERFERALLSLSCTVLRKAVGKDKELQMDAPPVLCESIVKKSPLVQQAYIRSLKTQICARSSEFLVVAQHRKQQIDEWNELADKMKNELVATNIELGKVTQHRAMIKARYSAGQIEEWKRTQEARVGTVRSTWKTMETWKKYNDEIMKVIPTFLDAKTKPQLDGEQLRVCIPDTVAQVIHPTLAAGGISTYQDGKLDLVGVVKLSTVVLNHVSGSVAQAAEGGQSSVDSLTPQIAHRAGEQEMLLKTVRSLKSKLADRLAELQSSISVKRDLCESQHEFTTKSDLCLTSPRKPWSIRRAIQKKAAMDKKSIVQPSTPTIARIDSGALSTPEGIAKARREMQANIGAKIDMDLQLEMERNRNRAKVIQQRVLQELRRSNSHLGTKAGHSRIPPPMSNLSSKLSELSMARITDEDEDENENAPLADKRRLPVSKKTAASGPKSPSRLPSMSKLQVPTRGAKTGANSQSLGQPKSGSGLATQSSDREGRTKEGRPSGKSATTKPPTTAMMTMMEPVDGVVTPTKPKPKRFSSHIAVPSPHDQGARLFEPTSPGSPVRKMDRQIEELCDEIVDYAYDEQSEIKPFALDRISRFSLGRPDTVQQKGSHRTDVDAAPLAVDATPRASRLPVSTLASPTLDTSFDDIPLLASETPVKSFTVSSDDDSFEADESHLKTPVSASKIAKPYFSPLLSPSVLIARQDKLVAARTAQATEKSHMDADVDTNMDMDMDMSMDMDVGAASGNGAPHLQFQFQPVHPIAPPHHQNDQIGGGDPERDDDGSDHDDDAADYEFVDDGNFVDEYDLSTPQEHLIDIDYEADDLGAEPILVQQTATGTAIAVSDDVGAVANTDADVHVEQLGRQVPLFLPRDHDPGPLSLDEQDHYDSTDSDTETSTYSSSEDQDDDSDGGFEHRRRVPITLAGSNEPPSSPAFMLTRLRQHPYAPKTPSRFNPVAAYLGEPGRGGDGTVGMFGTPRTPSQSMLKNVVIHSALRLAQARNSSTSDTKARQCREPDEETVEQVGGEEPMTTSPSAPTSASTSPPTSTPTNEGPMSTHELSISSESDDDETLLTILDCKNVTIGRGDRVVRANQVQSVADRLVVIETPSRKHRGIKSEPAGRPTATAAAIEDEGSAGDESLNLRTANVWIERTPRAARTTPSSSANSNAGPQQQPQGREEAGDPEQRQQKYQDMWFQEMTVPVHEADTMPVFSPSEWLGRPMPEPTSPLKDIQLMNGVDLIEDEEELDFLHDQDDDVLFGEDSSFVKALEEEGNALMQGDETAYFNF